MQPHQLAQVVAVGVLALWCRAVSRVVEQVLVLVEAEGPLPRIPFPRHVGVVGWARRAACRQWKHVMLRILLQEKERLLVVHFRVRLSILGKDI